MDQRLARVALRSDAKLCGQVFQLAAQHRHAIGRGGERVAGPDAGMDRQRDDLALVDDRSDEQVDRHHAMDARDAVGFDHQRHALWFTAQNPCARAFEIGKRARIRPIAEQRRRAGATNAQPVFQPPIAMIDHAAQLRQVPIRQPAHQRRRFGIGKAARIVEHRRLHARPIGHRRMDIGQGLVQRLGQFAPGARIDALGFKIDHRFAQFTDRLAIGQRGQFAIGPAPHRHDRMHQPIDRQPMLRNRGADRIDQERHIVVDHRDAQEAWGTVGAGHAFDRQRRFGALAPRRRAQRKPRRLRQAFGIEISGFGRQQRIGEPLRQRRLQRQA